MNDDKHLEVDEELANEFEESISERYPDELLIWCGGLDSILDSRKAYMLMEEYCSTACVIYPYKKIFTLRTVLRGDLPSCGLQQCRHERKISF